MINRELKSSIFSHISGYRAMLYSRNDQIKNIRKTNSSIQMISIRNKVIRMDSNENKHAMKTDLQFLKLKLWFHSVS